MRHQLLCYKRLIYGTHVCRWPPVKQPFVHRLGIRARQHAGVQVEQLEFVVLLVHEQWLYGGGNVINRKGKGVLIIKLRGTRFALGYNMTKNIEVSEAENGQKQ